MRAMVMKAWRTTAVVTFGVGFVVLGQRSDALAGDQDWDYNHECLTEGCDSEERREYYDNGAYANESMFESHNLNVDVEEAVELNTAGGNQHFCAGMSMLWQFRFLDGRPIDYTQLNMMWALCTYPP